MTADSAAPEAEAARRREVVKPQTAAADGEGARNARRAFDLRGCRDVGQHPSQYLPVTLAFLTVLQEPSGGSAGTSHEWVGPAGEFRLDRRAAEPRAGALAHTLSEYLLMTDRQDARQKTSTKPGPDRV